MKSNYKKLGPYIREVVEKNSYNQIEKLRGVSIQKCFITSIANTIGTDMTTYKIVKENQFAYGPVTSRNGDKISVALLQESDCIISTSYTVFEIINHNDLLPEYLMMWFRRPEFDRYARFMSHGSVREIFGWEEMCNVELPIPSLEKQKEIVNEYNTIVNRIKLNEQLNQKLEETAQAIYKQWFVDFEFPDENGKPYKSSGGKMKYCEVLDREIPIGWGNKKIANLIGDSVGGDWGRSEAEGNFTHPVLCIRGTDIPNVSSGILDSPPLRYILPKNYSSKGLRTDQIVIEISGGSPIQSTGRAVLVTDSLLKSSAHDMICSNFCRVIKLKNNHYAEFLYRAWRYLYNTGLMFKYENSTTGVKNFDLDGFASQEAILTPATLLIKKFNTIEKKLAKQILITGQENQLLQNSHDLLLSNFILRNR
jgi:type I restriction enzyme S subunit